MAGSLGGRPKADIWEHVEILDDKRVKCKYCGLAFAKSANRIKSHVSQTEGKGIRICPQFPQPNTNSKKTLNNNISSSSLQENLIGSQGSRILNRPRDHNELNENMLDCYMSPKTMWEGITQQQVQIDTKTEQHEMKQVGPFSVCKMMDACDLQLIEYVFDPSLDKSERVFSSSDSYLDRNEFITLKPQSLLNSMIINIFVEYSTDIERKRRSSNLNWYLPITFSTSALTSDVKSFLSFVEKQQMREKYMSKLVDCEKIFIPIHTDKGCGHFYLYVIHLKTKEIEIWDSFPFLTKEEEHREKTQKLLLAFTILFVDDMWDNGRKISYFQRIVVKDTPSQLNEYDCGIFLINFMHQSANANRNHSPQLFHSDEERLNLALKLLKSHLNKERENLYYKAMNRHLPIDKNLSGLKRKGIDICGGFSKDVQTKEYTILVQNHIGEIGVQENLDISNFEAGLTQDMGKSPSSAEKIGVKKGPWTPEEDKKLIDFILKYGHGKWRSLPKNAGLKRSGKSCRLRWTNYLRPDIKRGTFSVEEEDLIIDLQCLLGNKWSMIAARFPGRSDYEIKNYWKTHIKKKLLKMGIDPVTHAPHALVSFSSPPLS